MEHSRVALTGDCSGSASSSKRATRPRSATFWLPSSVAVHTTLAWRLAVAWYHEALLSQTVVGAPLAWSWSATNGFVASGSSTVASVALLLPGVVRRRPTTMPPVTRASEVGAAVCTSDDDDDSGNGTKTGASVAFGRGRFTTWSITSAASAPYVTVPSAAVALRVRFTTA